MEHMHRSTEAAAVDLLEAFLHDVLSQESGWDEWTWEKRNPLFQHIPAVFGCIGDPMGGYIWGPEVWDPPSFFLEIWRDVLQKHDASGRVWYPVVI